MGPNIEHFVTLVDGEKIRHVSVLIRTAIVILWSQVALHAQTNLNQGLRLEKERKYKEAAEVYKTIISQDRKDPVAYFRLGTLFLREFGDLDRAIDNLEQAVKRDGRNGEYHFVLSEAYAADFQQTGILRKLFIAGKIREELEVAVMCKPYSVPYREGLIQYYVFAPGLFGGSFSKAHLHADSISAIDQYAGLLAHAGIYAAEGDNRKAEEVFQMAGEPKQFFRVDGYCHEEASLVAPDAYRIKLREFLGGL